MTYIGRAAAIALSLTLAGCGIQSSAPPSTSETAQLGAVPPKPAPSETRRQIELRRSRVADARSAAQGPQSEDSKMIADYYARIETELLARGKMRTDDGTSEGPLTVAQMVDDFVAIALHDEYTRTANGLIRQPHPAPLRRWETPVRIRLAFGDSVSHGQRVRDRDIVSSYAGRLAQASRHDVATSAEGGNFIVFVVHEDERRALGPKLAAAAPGIPQGDIAALTALNPQTPCTVLGYSRGDSSVYVQAVGVIRAELPSRTRTSCYHEEIAQGLGLPNDSYDVHPSIFNDDEEFAHLTRHDELLLEMLYDPRLRPGMTEAEARPILHDIATGLLHPNS